MKSTPLFSLLLCVLFLLSFASNPSPASAATPPNIILIFADDLGYGDLSSYGSTVIHTPRIDQMASQGARFTDFYVPANICSPSRAALLTGAYPQRAGLPNGISPKRPEHAKLGLHQNEITIAELLKTANYKTMCIGKWHLGFTPYFHPQNHGFDHYYGMLCNYQHDPRFWKDQTVIAQKTDLTTMTEKYTAAALKFIRQNKNNPFFLFLPHTYPHLPIQPNPKFAGQSKAKAYGDVIEEIDHSVGQILDTLKQLNLDNNTLVIFTSDNGPTPQAASAHNSNGPLRGSKYTTEEAGHRVPFIARWPGRIPPGLVQNSLATSMDIFPTLAKLANIPMPNDRLYDGFDLWPRLTNPNAKTPYEVLYFYNNTNLQAVRFGQWKLHLPRSKEMLPFWQTNKGITQLDSPVLYDLKNDPGETTDVAAQHPGIVAEIQSLASQARAELGSFHQQGTAVRATGEDK